MNTLPNALASLSRRVLRALFELAQLDCPAQAGVLARSLAASPTQVAAALLALDAAGLVSADRARLTLAGLAVAARLPALGLSAPARTPASARPAMRARGLAKATPRVSERRVASPLSRALGH